MQNNPEKYQEQRWTLPELFAQNVLLHRSGLKWFIVVYGKEMPIDAFLGESLALQIEQQHSVEEEKYRRSFEFRFIRWRYKVRLKVRRLFGGRTNV